MLFSEIDLPLAELLEVAERHPENPCPAGTLDTLVAAFAPLVELTEEEIRAVLDIESDPYNAWLHPLGVHADYHMTSVTYRGVVQTSVPNWDDSREWLQLSADTKRYVPLVGSTPSVSTPAYQLAMMFVYAQRYRRSVGATTWSGRALYTLHNQGPRGLRAFAETGRVAGKQSAMAVAFMNGKKARGVYATVK